MGALGIVTPLLQMLFTCVQSGVPPGIYSLVQYPHSYTPCQIAADNHVLSATENKEHISNTCTQLDSISKHPA